MLLKKYVKRISKLLYGTYKIVLHLINVCLCIEDISEKRSINYASHFINSKN